MNTINNLSVNDYCQQKELIAQILKNEFIDALHKAVPLRDKVKFLTHSWLLKYVIADPRVQDIWHFKIEPLNKVASLKKEIIIMLSFTAFWKQRYYITFQTDRPIYFVVLTRKSLNRE
jgi:hypothetical protein